MQTASSSVPESSSSRQLRWLLTSGHPLLYIISAEELRVGRLLRQASRAFFSETCAAVDMEPYGGHPMRRRRAWRQGHDRPACGARLHRELRGPGDIPPEGLPRADARRRPTIRRRLRDVYELCLDRGKFVVISSPVRFIPDELLARHRSMSSSRFPTSSRSGRFSTSAWRRSRPPAARSTRAKRPC